MKKEKSEERIIPLKNYIILGVIVLITIVLTLYVNAWLKTYKNVKLNVSPLSEVINEVSISEVKIATSEMKNIILYVSYTNDKDIHKNEMDLLKYIKKNNLTDTIIYVNVVDYLENKEYINILKKSFPEIKDIIQEAPMMIYIENGIPKELIKSNDKAISKKEISLLYDKYELNN